MDETIKAMLEALKETNAGYVRITLGDYAVMVATKDTADFMEQLYDVATDIEEE